MYSILIADDELMMREGLKKNLSASGLFEIDTAEDGLEAVNKIKSKYYDAVVLDIVMPRMTGLEVLESIMPMKPAPIKIIMSGYDRFEYAQEAITYGISDFILKPLTPEIIDALSKKLSQLIDTKRSLEGREKEVLAQIERMKPILVERFLEMLVLQPHLPDHIMERFDYYGINFPYSYFRCAVLSLEMLDKSTTIMIPECSMARGIVMNMIRERMGSHLDIKCFSLSDETVGIIFNTEKANNSNMIDEVLLSVATEVRNMFQSDFVCGVGNTVDGIAKISLSFKQAQNAYYCNRSMRISPMLYYIDLGESYDVFSDDVDYLELCTQIKNDEIKDYIGRIHYISKKKAISYQSFQLIVTKVVLACQSVCHDFDIKPNPEKLLPLLPYMFGNESKQEKNLDDLLCELIEDVNAQINAVKTQKKNYIIDRAKKIIDENYMTNISVSSIGDALGISKNYFGKLFKIYMGISVSNYVNSIRIKNAIEMLQKTNMKVYEIGEAVGYSDQHYFSISFKKNVGVSPSEFRELM